MSHGYSVRLAKAILAADVGNPGVQLGRACLLHDVPVSEVAKAFRCTRTAVYNWFCGRSHPQKETWAAIQAYIDDLNRR
jgi:hypothetical protein